MMAYSARFEGRAPFENLSKTTITYEDIKTNANGSTTSSVKQPLMDYRERKRQRERDRYAQLSCNQKDELLKKCREARQQKRVVATHVNAEQQGQMGSELPLQKELQYIPTTSDGDAMCNKENKACQSHKSINMEKKYVHTQQLTTSQIEARRANARARYANLTPKQRQAIRDRQRLLYAKMTSEQKQAKRNNEKARRMLQRFVCRGK